MTNQSNDNPFYNAWMQDRNKGISSAAHENYYLMQQSLLKESIVQSLIEAMIKQKVFISTRTFYNFLYEIVVPVNNKISDAESISRSGRYAPESNVWTSLIVHPYSLH